MDGERIHSWEGLLQSAEHPHQPAGTPDAVDAVATRHPDVDVCSLGPLGFMALDHWKRFCPEMYEQLRQAGELESRAYEAQEESSLAIGNLIEQGVNPYLAGDEILPLLILLPAEESVAELVETAQA